MKKLISLIFITSLLISLSACQKKQRFHSSPDKTGISVSFCSDILGEEEPIFTKPVLTIMESMANTGIIRLTKQVCTNKADYINQLSVCAQSSDLIFGGALMAEELIEVSHLFPNKFFVLLDFPAKGSNIASVLFREEDMLKRAMTICLNNSKTKKIGALFPGDPTTSLSIVLKNTIPALVDFIPLDSSSEFTINKLNSFSQNQVDFVYLAKAPYLEDVVASLAKDNKTGIQLVCPRIILSPGQSSVVFATIEKNYQPILYSLIKAYETKQIKAQTYFSSDFISVLTR